MRGVTKSSISHTPSSLPPPPLSTSNTKPYGGLMPLSLRRPPLELLRHSSDKAVGHGVPLLLSLSSSSSSSLFFSSLSQRRAMDSGPAWHEAFPKPRTQSPAGVSRQELLQWLQDGKKPGKDFLLVDLRRTDHEVKRHRLKIYPSPLSLTIWRCRLMSEAQIPGRHHQRVDQPPCSEFISQPSDHFDAVSKRWHTDRGLVLW